MRAVLCLFIIAIGFQVAAFVGRFASDYTGLVLLVLTVMAAPIPFVWMPGDRIPPATQRDPCPICGYPLGAGGHDYAHEHHERTGRRV